MRERETIVNSMISVLENRGPDGKGIESSPNITLGHTRLAVLDLTENADQPMCDESSRFFIVYNGEVYNFNELREELIKLNYEFFSTSDTEVVLKSYIQWGVECFKKFDGMFAIAIWDRMKSDLVLARDPFGKKPLHYYLFPDFSVSFASTLTSIMKDPDIPQKTSMEALNCFLALGYILTPSSLIEGVKKLEPSHYLLLNLKSKKMKKVKYWDYAGFFLNKTREPEKEICERIYFLIKKAVKKRMVSDVPLGVFFSSGIDSNSILKIARDYEPEISAFTIGFDDPRYDELSFAREIAEAINLENHFWKILSVDKYPDEMSTMFEAFDEPFADTSLLPMMMLSSFAKSKITVALSGDGADEIFGGYVTYKADSLAIKYRNIPLSLRKNIASLARHIPVSLNKKVGLDYKMKQFFHGAVYDEERSHYLWRLMYNEEERMQLLGSEYREVIYDTDPFIIFKKYYDEVKGLNSLDRHLYVDAKTWLVDDILVKVDRSTMFVGLEARCPFLDKELAEYVAGIPDNLKVKDSKLKYLFKKVMSEYLPHDVIKKRKSGFNAPVSRWIDQTEYARNKMPLALKNEYCRFVWYVHNNYLTRRKYSYE